MVLAIWDHELAIGLWKITIQDNYNTSKAAGLTITIVHPEFGGGVKRSVYV